jgi:hypothetical protein
LVKEYWTQNPNGSLEPPEVFAKSLTNLLVGKAQYRVEEKE